MQSTHRLAIIGAGDMGLTRAIIAKGLPQYELVCIVDKNPLIGRVAAKQFNISYYRKYKEAAKREIFDTVMICTTARTHRDIALEVLKEKKNIFCEKPLSVNLEASREMVRAIEKAGVINQVGYNFRFYPTFNKAKELIENGVLGDMIYIKALGYKSEVIGPETRAEKKEREEHYGIYDSIGVHISDLMLWFGGRISSISAQKTRKYSSGLYDFVSAVCKFQNGIHALIDFTWSQHGIDPSYYSLMITGTNGTMTVDTDCIEFFLEESVEELEKGTHMLYAAEIPCHSAFGFRLPGLSQEMETFSKNIVAGKQAEPSWHDGCLVDELIAGIDLSASSGRQVSFPMED